MNGKAVQTSHTFLTWEIISTAQISLGFSDTPLEFSYLYTFSMIRVFLPSRKLEEGYAMKGYGRVWCTLYYWAAPTVGSTAYRTLFTWLFWLQSQRITPLRHNIRKTTGNEEKPHFMERSWELGKNDMKLWCQCIANEKNLVRCQGKCSQEDDCNSLYQLSWSFFGGLRLLPTIFTTYRYGGEK